MSTYNKAARVGPMLRAAHKRRQEAVAAKARASKLDGTTIQAAVEAIECAMISIACGALVCAKQEPKLFVKGAKWQAGWVAAARSNLSKISEATGVEIPWGALERMNEAAEILEAR